MTGLWRLFELSFLDPGWVLTLLTQPCTLTLDPKPLNPETPYPLIKEYSLTIVGSLI